jgi:hypothetical protein
LHDTDQRHAHEEERGDEAVCKTCREQCAPRDAPPAVQLPRADGQQQDGERLEEEVAEADGHELRVTAGLIEPEDAGGAEGAEVGEPGATQGRSSTRRTERESTTKKTAIIRADATWAVMLHRHSRSSMDGDDCTADDVGPALSRPNGDRSVMPRFGPAESRPHV